MADRRFVAEGHTPTYTAPSGGVVAGTGLLIGSKFVIPTVTVDTGVRFAAHADGIVEHAKVSAQAWTEGVKVYFDAAQELVTTTSGGNTLIGTAYEAAANPSARGTILLGWVA